MYCKVAGLRDVLEDSDEDDNHPHSVSTVNDMAIAASKPDSNSLLFGVSLCNQNPDILQRPHHEVRIRLYDIYRSRVDPICKVLHWPSTQSLLGSEDFHLGDAEQTISYQALENSICFAALCTLLDGEIENRRSLVQHYRLATELSLVRARLLSSRDFLVLQAFVIYLVRVVATFGSESGCWKQSSHVDETDFIHHVDRTSHMPKHRRDMDSNRLRCSHRKCSRSGLGRHERSDAI